MFGAGHPGLAGPMMSGAALVLGQWLDAATFAAIFVVQMVQGLRYAGRRALAPGLLLLLAWAALGGLGAFGLWFSYWLETQLVVGVAFVVEAVLGFAVLLPIFLALTQVILAARRRMAPDGRELLARDQRPPIVYLRSFVDDTAEGDSPDSGGFVFGTYEERLIRAMRAYGPVVAIGQPGERLPPLGAARIYAGDADWQRTVSELAAKARLVVLRPAATESVLWEAAMAVRVAGQDKVALYVRGLRRGVWEEFARQLGDTLGASLPRAPESGAIVLYVRDGNVQTLRWEQPDTIGEQGQYVLTRSFLKPLFPS
jgi:hypothetical protein